MADQYISERCVTLAHIPERPRGAKDQHYELELCGFYNFVEEQTAPSPENAMERIRMISGVALLEDEVTIIDSVFGYRYTRDEWGQFYETPFIPAQVLDTIQRNDRYQVFDELEIWTTDDKHANAMLIGWIDTGSEDVAYMLGQWAESSKFLTSFQIIDLARKDATEVVGNRTEDSLKYQGIKGYLKSFGLGLGTFAILTGLVMWMMPYSLRHASLEEMFYYLLVPGIFGVAVTLLSCFLIGDNDKERFQTAFDVLNALKRSPRLAF